MLSHVNQNNRPAMVNVGSKPVTSRTARAGARVRLTPEAAARFENGDLRTKKGPVFQTASLAGVMAAKRTHELIPLCHPLPLHDVQVHIELVAGGVAVIEASASAEARTGVEMEALAAASVAALTIYDMVKSLGLGTTIEEIRLLEKTGGKSDFRAGDHPPAGSAKTPKPRARTTRRGPRRK